MGRRIGLRDGREEREKGLGKFSPVKGNSYRIFHEPKIIEKYFCLTVYLPIASIHEQGG